MLVFYSKDKVWAVSDVRLEHFIIPRIRIFKNTLKSHQNQVYMEVIYNQSLCFRTLNHGLTKILAKSGILTIVLYSPLMTG